MYVTVTDACADCGQEKLPWTYEIVAASEMVAADRQTQSPRSTSMIERTRIPRPRGNRKANLFLSSIKSAFLGQNPYIHTDVRDPD
jgi:hypothetical protein